MTRFYKIFTSKTIKIWSAIALQLAFADIILFKNHAGKRSGRIGLVRIVSRDPIVDIHSTEAWNRVLILAVSISISIISICLARAYFPIFFYKAISSKMKSVIILG